MDNTKEKPTSEEVISWFDDSENFKHLPIDIQESIVRFFVEQPVTAVDACQIIEFLTFGSNFAVYYDYNEFIDSLDFSNTKAILVCKANFECADGVSDWLDSIHPKLVKTIPPSDTRIKELQQKYDYADLFIKLETEYVYEADVLVVPMFNTIGYLDMEYYVVNH